jgi:cytoskeletal protein RodZ
MELIIAIIIIAIGVAIWYNRKAPAQPVVEAETYSDNGIKFASKEETVVVTAPVVETPAPAVVEEAPAKKPRAPRKPKVEKAPKAAKPKAPATKTTTTTRSKKA